MEDIRPTDAEARPFGARASGGRPAKGLATHIRRQLSRGVDLVIEPRQEGAHVVDLD